MELKTLRDYGFLMGGAVVGLFSVYPWLVLKRDFVGWPWAVLAGFWGLALVYPKALNPLYRAWMRVGLVLGKINSTILLTACYFVLFFPLAILFRLMKRDRLRRFSARGETTFRQLREIPREVKQMEQPF
jgi:hypothetical protein